MPDKLTDNDIKKSLGDCAEYCDDCLKCPSFNFCNEHDSKTLITAVLDIINRLEAERDNLKESRDRWKQIAEDFDKASRDTEKEIEGLQAENERLQIEKDNLIKTYSECQVANLKEYVKRLKEKAYTECDITGYKYQVVQIEEIDNTLIEMVGDNNAL